MTDAMLSLLIDVLRAGLGTIAGIYAIYFGTIAIRALITGRKDP